MRISISLNMMKCFAMSVLWISADVAGFLLEGGMLCDANSICMCDWVGMYCQSRGLTEVPQFSAFSPEDLREQFISIELGNNNIRTVREKAFQALSSLNGSTKIELWLDYNNISSFADDALEGVEDNMHAIYLTNNQLTGLPAALGTLTNLFELRIDQNPIKSLDGSVMSHIGHFLGSFTLDMHFPTWPNEMRYLHNLRELLLYLISFGSIPSNALDESGVKYLYITTGHLQAIPSAICQLRNLYKFDLSGQLLPASNVSLFNPCQNDAHSLKIMRLESNQLTAFPDVLHSFPDLVTLGLRYNRIKYIPSDLIPDTSLLEFLDIKGNRLTRIPSVLSKLKKLRNLNLDNNQITTIESTDLSGFQRLGTLSMHSNPLTHVDPHSFDNNTQLYDLDLSRTNLTIIPEAVLHMQRLSVFEFTDNYYLNCSCGMSYLKQWNLTRLSTFSGNCQNNPTVSLKQYISSSLQQCS